ncbi:hypothetical protein PVAP13_5NG012592 [Panicum virgatum]|uniref:C2H2-type domain-containing protein n=1 Tax=Panicum virgatum TaxID=38727 RepID=A0A8T0S689_PANVG|nr:hypothetical protein PVAP13_5NG012592 [Panicum virgatum]
MEFWGKEVKPGTKVSCKANEGYVIHLSQAALGEAKKESENIVVSVKVDDNKLVLGTLSVEKHPQIACDLIFESDFELLHNEELETDEIPIKKDEITKSAANVLVKNGKNVEQDVDEEMSSGDDDFTDDSDDTEMSEDGSSDEEMSSATDLSGDSEDESEESEEEQTPTPKKPEVVGKKRAIEAVTPSGKKAKVEPTGLKTGDKKVHVSTLHPTKQASKTPADKSGKTPATDKKSKEKSPKSGGHACKTCSKAFGSESALESHKKAKHEA